MAPVDPVMDPSAVILVLVDATTADLQAAAGTRGAPAGQDPPSKGRGLDFYA
jgi:hypothetical protein